VLLQPLPDQSAAGGELWRMLRTAQLYSSELTEETDDRPAAGTTETKGNTENEPGF
jgi:hypothetical protein